MPEEIETLRSAITDALACIGRHENPRVAYGQATTVGVLARELLDAAALARGRALGRIRRAEELSLAELADSVHMSKTRVQQLMERAGEDVPAE